MGALLFSILILTANAFELLTPDDQPFTDTKDPTAVQLQKALEFLDGLPPLADAPDDFDPNVIDAAPAKFFSTRVDKIIVDTRADSPECEDGRLAFVHTVYRAEKKMWICPLITRYDVLTVANRPHTRSAARGRAGVRSPTVSERTEPRQSRVRPNLRGRRLLRH